MRHSIATILLLLGILSSSRVCAQPFASHYIEGDPALEIIQARQGKVVNAPPLLFIHGYRMGAWIFEDTYLPFFYERGFDVFAVNLRGHGWSEGAETIRQATLDEYYADLLRAVAYVQAETGEIPVLVGFSLGGVLVQRYLADHEPEAVVLLGAGDIRSALPYFDNWRRRQFAEQVKTLQPGGNLDTLYHRPAFHRALFFSPGEKSTGHKKYITRMVTQAGSGVVWSELASLVLPPFSGKTKVLIVAGDQDPLTPPVSLARARRAYDAELVVLEDTRHGIPVGEHWKKGAKSVLAFLRQLPEQEKSDVSLMGTDGH